MKPGDPGKDVLLVFNDILLGTGRETATVKRNEYVEPDWVLVMTQSIEGIPVYGSGVSMAYDQTTLRVSGFTAAFLPDRGLPRTPKLSALEAEQILPKALAANGMETLEVKIRPGTRLEYYVDWSGGTPPTLAWVVPAYIGHLPESVVVDAATGEVLWREKEYWQMTTSVHDAAGSTPDLPDSIPSQMTVLDQQGTNARNNVNDAYAKLKSRFSYLPSSGPSTVWPNLAKLVIRHKFPQPPGNPNAQYWRSGTTTDVLAFSDAIAPYAAYTDPRDIAAHEFGHGLTYRVGLGTQVADPGDDQMSAVHEFFADVMTTVVDAQWRGADAWHTWRIGEGMRTDGPYAFRSLRSPAFDAFTDQDRNNQNWFPTHLMTRDVDYSHRNATILGHAYYLMVMGGQHEDVAASDIPDITVPALSPIVATSEIKASDIMMRAFRREELRLTPDFPAVKKAAMGAAQYWYGDAARTSVKKAFEAVGICDVSSAPPTTAPAVSIHDFYCEGTFRTSWPLMPGVNRYYAEVAPPGWGWSFAQTISDVDGSTSTCNIRVGADRVYRVRACNDCGCGPWSSTHYLNYVAPCL